MKYTCTIVIFSLILFITAQHSRADSLHTISGTVSYKQQGKIYIALVDKETFGMPMKGVQEKIISITKNETTEKKVGFKFENIPTGTYGIRLFQDTNNNGNPDKGMFGPKEPWTMSWNEKKPLKWPKFENLCFTVDSDTTGIDLELNK